MMADSEAGRLIPDSEADRSSKRCEGEASISSSDVEEASPDSLKNTPSNIAKLEDVIEHCVARKKYLARTTSPSDGSDVRWYFCKVPLAQNEPAASMPKTEIVGKGDFFRFGMRDSLALEASFLQREEELLSYWWKEYAECSEGPRVKSSAKKLDAGSSSSQDGAPSNQSYEVEEERVGVPVKGGLYEVDLMRRHCFPVYWNGENRRVLRGHWFACKGGLDWLPLREDVAEQLEIAYRSQVWHRRTFQPSGLFAARVDLQGSTPGLHALFTGEDDTWEAWLNNDASGVSSLITISGHGTKLRRGYASSHSPKPTQDELRQQKEEEMDDYCSQVPVRHLVFMVHGIGQRLEKSNLVDDVANFRHITARLAEQHLTPHQRSTQRVLFIPCQWRRGLKLSGESAVEKITLDGVRGLRTMLSATVHDVLYYMSPIYCQDIINSVSNQLNRLYLKFIKRKPGYDGKVSIYGHSLGSVLSYDILCHQENLSSPFPMEWMYQQKPRSKETFHDNLPDKDNEKLKTVDASDDVTDSIDKDEDRVTGPLLQEKEYAIDKDEDRVTGPLLQEKEYAKEFPFAADPVTSDPQHLAASGVGSSSSSEEDSVESVCNSEGEIQDQNTSIVDSAVIPSSEQTDDTSGARSKEQVIKMLKEEIKSLEARVKDLAARHGNSDASAELEERNTSTAKPMPQKFPLKQDSTPKSYTPYIKYTKLEFKVDTFFAVGSPLGVFLSLRNIRIGIGKGRDYWQEENITEEIPACRRMFNIFHPYDPVAYRVEPLVCKEYIDKRPVLIPYHRGGKRLHIGFQEFTENLAARTEAIVYRLNSVKVKVLTACQSKKSDMLEEEEEDSQGKKERSYGSMMMERLTGSEEGQIDHMLQDKTFGHPYLQALGAHTNYWRDYDTALFILNHLYQNVCEDPPSSPGESSGDNSKTESHSTGWFADDKYDEDFPFTFSDKNMAWNFSRRVKKIMKDHS